MSKPVETMRAAILDGPGAAFEVRNIPRPRPESGQVLVVIGASGVNPLDTKIRAGEAAHARHPLPAILGLDMAGTVVEIGPGATGFQPGDQVYGLTGGVGGCQGSLAEFAAVDGDLLELKPANLSMRAAAAVPLVFITAWEGLVDHAGIRAGQKVLVHGGAGGIGHVAVQIARAFGCEVYATGRPEHATYIRSLGATPIDFTAENIEDYVARHTSGAGFDVVYDTGGGVILDSSFIAVKRFGHVVSALGWGTHSLAPLSFKAASYSGVFTLLPLLTGEGRAHHGEIMVNATRLIEEGKVVPRLDARHFNLGTVGEAHDLLGHRAARGKLVVEIGT